MIGCILGSTYPYLPKDCDEVIKNIPRSVARGGAKQRALAVAGVGLSVRERSRSRSCSKWEWEDASGSTGSRTAPYDDVTHRPTTPEERVQRPSSPTADRKERSRGCPKELLTLPMQVSAWRIPKKTDRDLMRKLLKSVTAPPVYWAHLPLHDHKVMAKTTCPLARVAAARDVCFDHGSRLQLVTFRGPALAALVAVPWSCRTSMDQT